MVALAARSVSRALLRWPPLAVPARMSALLAEEARGFALWLPVAFGAGIAAYLALTTEPNDWAALLASAFSLALLGACWRLGGLRRMAGLLLAASLGFAAIHARAMLAPPVEPLPARAVVLEAQVVSVEALPQARRLTLADAMWEGRDQPLPRTLRLRLRTTDSVEVQPGDRIRVRALLRPPSAPAEPGAFDFQRAAFFAGQGGFGFALGQVEVTRPRADEAEGGIGTWFARLRAEVVARTRAAVPGDAGAVAAALLTGQQAGISAEAQAAMRDSGLSHLLSVSGLHVSIVMGTLFVALRFLLALWEWAALRLPIKAIALVAGFLAGVFYMGLTGSQVPMQRSVLMAGLVVAALLAGRNPISLRALALAALVVLALSPDALVSASFQMSFAAVAALVAGFEALRGHLPRWLAHPGFGRRALMWLIGLIATSVLAGLATAPYAAFHFQRASLYGVVANALAVPLTGVFVMPAGMVAMLLMPLGLDWFALVPMGWGCALVLEIGRAVAAWPGAAPFLPAMPGWGLLLCTAGLLALCLLRTRLRLLGAPLFVAGMVSPTFHVPPDLLVSADAGLIAIRQGGALHVAQAQGTSRFALEAWQRRAGGISIEKLACTEPFCRVGDVALVPRGPMPPGLCGSVPVIVSHEPLRRNCRASLAIDRFDVWRNGPHAVWLTGEGPVMISDRAARGDRPWVPPRPRPRNADPPARVE
jgi:competence protein ComEC